MMNKYIKIIFVILLFFVQLSIGAIDTYADSTASYIGSDASQKQISDAKTLLNIKTFSWMTSTDAGSLYGSDITSPATDGLVYTNNAKPLVVDFAANTDKQITPLGYTDLLLLFGFYSGKVSVSNNTTLISIAEAAKAYESFGGSIPQTLIDNFNQGYNLYLRMYAESSNADTSGKAFFFMIKNVMDEPDANLATNSIVDLSLARYQIKPSKQLKQDLYTWIYKYALLGTKENSFYKEVNVYQKGNVVYVSYGQLFSAPQTTTVTNTQKLLALVLFLIFLTLVFYLMYRTKTYINKEQNGEQ